MCLNKTWCCGGVIEILPHPPESVGLIVSLGEKPYCLHCKKYQERIG